MNSYHRDGKAINPQLLVLSLLLSLFLPPTVLRSGPDRFMLAGVCDISTMCVRLSKCVHVCASQLPLRRLPYRPDVYNQGLDKYWPEES